MASRGRVAGAPRAAPRRSPAHDEEGAPDGRRIPRRWRESRLARTCAAHPDRAAALLLALFVFALLWPALIGSKILSPMAVVYQVPPWAAATPSDIYDWFNPLLSDIPMADYPWRFLARELIHSGTFPAWNPHNFAGVPLFNNPQVGLFTPFNLPLWILPLNYALGLSAAIKLWFGGFGAYLLVRQLSLGFLPGLLAGVSFAFCSLNIVWLTHETLPAVAVMVPWALWLVERILARGRLGSVLGLGAVVAVGLGGGHPGMQVHLLAAIALYAVLRVLVSGERAWSDRLRRLAAVGGGIVLGTLVMGLMLVPEILASRGTLGTVARAPGRSTLPGAEMPFDAILTTIAPDWWGRPNATEVVGTSPSGAGELVNYNERTFYAGLVALLLAFVALVSLGRWRAKAPFVVLAAIGIAVPLHAPGIYWLVTHLPAFELVQNQRMHFVFSLGVAVLAAFGLRAVLDRPRGEAWRLLVPALGIVAGVLLFRSVDTGPQVLEALREHFLEGTDFTTEKMVEAGSLPGRVIQLTSATWLLLFALGVLLALALARLRPRWRVAIACLVVLLAAADMFHFAFRYQPMGPESQVIPPVTPAIEFLRDRSDEGRFTGMGFALMHDYALRYGIDDIRGYDPPQPTVRFYNLWRTANPQQSNWQPFSMPNLMPASLNVMSLLGARWVITGTDTDLTAGAGAGAFRLVYAGADAFVYRNARAVPRTFVPQSIVVTAGEGETLSTIADASFDPRRTVVVEADTPAAALADARPARGSARVVDEQNARVTIAAQLDRRGLVVLNDNLTEGWSVEVDGRPAEVVRVNSVVRGVVVDAGRHEIVWRYRVPGLRAGVGLSVLGLLGFAAGGAVLLRRRGADRRPPEPQPDGDR